jgi:hypothetical protein
VLTLLLLACPPGPVDTAVPPDTDVDLDSPDDTDEAADTDVAADTDDTDADTDVDTSWWECGDDGLSDPITLCADHRLYTCDVPAVGLRRGDWACLPGHAFCPDPDVYCDEGQEAWAEVPLAFPDGFRAVAEGVLASPEAVWESPIDAGFVPTASVRVRSLAEAASLFAAGGVSPGEEVVVADGTSSGCYANLVASGLPGAPIRVRAETPGGVVLDSCAIYLAGDYLVLDGFTFVGEMVYTPIAMGYGTTPCDNCAVRNLTIDTVVPAKPTNRPYVQTLGRGVEVSDSTFIGKTNSSAVITLDRVDPATPLESRVYRNYFADRGADAAANGYEVIRAGWSMDYFYPGYVVIEGNLFERCDGELETLSLKSGHDTVRFNTFRDNAGQVSVRAGFGVVVEGNYVLGADKTGSGGIRASGAGTLIVNNHVQALAPGASRWRAPVALATGSGDPYAEYNVTFEGAVLYNRAVSRGGFAMDTGEDYPPTFLPPHHNVYAANLFFTRGDGPALAWTFAASVDDNARADNWVDADAGVDGFDVSTATPEARGELWVVTDFERAVADEAVLDRLDGAVRDYAEDVLVLRTPGLYDAVPVLSVGDVGAP